MARLAGLALAAVSLLGLGAIAVHEAVTWAPGVTLAAKPYLDGVAPRRIAMIFAQRERFCCRRLPSQ